MKLLPRSLWSASFLCRLAAFSLVFLLPGGVALGRGDSPEPPHVAQIASYTQWRIDVSPSNSATEPVTLEEAKARKATEYYFPQLKRITGYKNDRIVHEVHTWKNNQKTEAFVVGGILYRASSPRYPEDILVVNPYVDGYPDFSKMSFPDLVWVSSKTFVKSAMEQGKACYYYEQSDGEGGLVRKAWIDAQTRLPVRYDDGKHVYTYSFSPASRREIIIPKAFRKFIPDDK